MLVSMMFLLLAAAAGVWLWLRWCYAEISMVAINNSLSIHPTWPLIGHIYFLANDIEGVSKIILEMSMRALENGMYTTCAWNGPIPYLFFHHPDDVKILLRSSKSQQKFDLMSLFGFALGNSLLTASGDMWRSKRRHLDPLFHPNNLEQLSRVLNKNTLLLVDRLSKKVDQGPVEMMDYIEDSNLQSICELIFGPMVKTDVKAREFQDIKLVIKSFSSLYIKRLLRVWNRPDFIFQLLHGKELRELEQRMRAFTDAPLKIAMEEVRKKEINGDNQLSSETKRNGYLNLVEAYTVLQKNNPEITIQDLRHEILTLYFTGSESVAVAVSSCILALAQYPELQTKLFQEIAAVVGLNRNPTTEDFKKMTYMDNVVKETLRRFTVIPYIGRKTTENVQLKSCTVPANNAVFVSILGPLMDPKQYPDPYKFDPERFSRDRTPDGEKLLFVPFSSGSRKCIGEKYSMLLMKTLLVHLVRRFRFSTEMDIHRLRRELAVTLVSVEGYKVTLTDRV